MGIKETLEVFAFLDAAGVAMAAARKDGKIDWKDALIPEVRALVPKFASAAGGAQIVVGEIKDLSADEIGEIYAAAVQAAKSLMNGLLGKV